jgi:hypothetical protein
MEVAASFITYIRCKGRGSAWALDGERMRVFNDRVANRGLFN